MNKLFEENCVIINTPSNLFYFTDYNSADAVLIFHNDKKYYFTDARYFAEVEKLLKGFEIMDIAILKAFIGSQGITKCGIEGNITLNFYNELLSFGIKDCSIIDKKVQDMRAVKKPYELERIKKAQKITDKTFADILPHIKEGITEIELAATLEGLLIKNGSEQRAFSSIVAFGENTAKPHAHRSNKALKCGMPITLDFGAKFDGYCSDMTRTVFFGAISKDMEEIYNCVYDAQKIALKNIKTGLSGKQCDSFARDYFKSKSLDSYFLHSLGHSLGIDIHEMPNFSQKCDAIMRQGMVMSVEPGLYLADKYGVRIEDIIYFDANGIKNLTKSPKNIIIIE